MAYRAAVIGCGRIGSDFDDDPRARGVYTHAGAYRACADTELVALCDVDAERARRCVARWSGTSAYSDVRRLLAEQRPEIVSVCTPDETHEAVLTEVLAAEGVRAVLAEKPLALDLAAARRLVDCARERGILLAVNYSRRYSRRLAGVRADLLAGRYGAIQKVAGLYTKGVKHNGSHWFDLARWLVGEVRAVAGFDNGEGPVADPTLDARLTFHGGATAFLQGCSADAYAVFEMDIVGTRGRVRIVDSGHRIETSRVAPSPRYSGYTSLHEDAPVDGDLDDAMTRAVEDLVACVREAREPACSGADGVAALRIAAALVDSAAQGRELELGGRMTAPVVVSVCGDPGGASALAPVLALIAAEGDLELAPYAYRQGLGVLERGGIVAQALASEPSVDSAEAVLRGHEAAVLVTATSCNGVDWEKHFVAAARTLRIPSIAVLDFWSSYRERFSSAATGLDRLPDAVAAMDEHARDAMREAGIPDAAIVVTGQPAFDALAETRACHDVRRRAATREKLGVAAGDLLVVFASQPLRQLYGTAAQSALGYDQDSVLRVLVEALEAAAADSARPVTLLVRPHPREVREDYEKYRGAKIRVAVSDADDGRAEVMAADLVTGMTTALLVEACYLGAVVVSLQPGLRGDDVLPTNRGGLSAPVYREDEVGPVVRRMLLDEEVRAAAVERVRLFTPDGKAAQRVADLVRAHAAKSRFQKDKKASTRA